MPEGYLKRLQISHLQVPRYTVVMAAIHKTLTDWKAQRNMHRTHHKYGLLLKSTETSTDLIVMLLHTSPFVEMST